ncbi:DUF1667 domain-containing protein [Crassaminicella thermophila]|uniref:DUF1667 domain-containing protein n=1 Tax=Crassaminicella thermophila TaxID=2599308 RepID=A0A5C0SG55_CRATE|nr:DUF1667 domain-containing protein [Crassaminicella thermophila]QEK12912.1 DUF1667 domain-containing protein [Crassaminicella thermophila]
MKREFTCIVCPNSCELVAEIEGKEIKSIEGALCKRGDEYVVQEIKDPKRTIATSVKVIDGEIPLASVRTTKPIPKDKIFEVMEEIKKVKVQAPVQINQVIIENVLNLGSDIIITKSVGIQKCIERVNKEVVAS